MSIPPRLSATSTERMASVVDKADEYVDEGMGPDQALAKAVTKTKSTPRRLAAERSLPAADARRALVDVAAALGIQPITVYQVQGDRLVESQALPIGAA